MTYNDFIYFVTFGRMLMIDSNFDYFNDLVAFCKVLKIWVICHDFKQLLSFGMICSGFCII